MKLKTKLKIAIITVALIPVVMFVFCLHVFDMPYMRQALQIAVFIIFFTDMAMMYWLYGSIIKPLRRLQAATKKVKEGNLDFTLERETKDEFGDLYRDFDDMRKRLKMNAEEKIQADQEAKELISNISHDLKTPITAIKGYVEGIMDGVANTPEKMDRYVKTIYAKANDMERLIAELTMFSQLDSNRIPYNFAKVNLAEYFQDCVDDLSIELEAKNIRLMYRNFADPAILVIADVEQMRRVINNIISNSIKYMDKPNGEIKIYILEEGDFVHIEMEDNGKGIEAKNVPYIFDRFYRTDSSRNSHTGGSGIGLSIVKTIIEAHGGKVWAASILGAGTTIHFVLRKYIETVSLTIEEKTQEQTKSTEKKERRKLWKK